MRSTVGINDHEIRETLAAMLTALDPEAEHELRHDDFVGEMPQSGERIRGRDAMRELQRAFPPETMPTFRVDRVLGSGDIWTIEAVGDYGGQIFHVVMIVELRDRKSFRETRYYPAPFDAPDWRARWAAPMEAGSPRTDPPQPIA